MASITLQNIVKEYGSGAKAVPVIHNLNAQINDGEFVVIVGPSGCGKSTLLRMAWKKLRAATSRLAIAWSTTLSPLSATLPWFFKTMRSTHT